MNEYGLEKTSLYNELTAIGAKDITTQYKLRVEIYYDTTVLEVFRVTTMLGYSDYELHYAEELDIDVAMNAGVYNVYVVPNNDILYANLFIERYVSGQTVVITKRAMRAYFKNTKDERLVQNDVSSLNQAAIGNLELGIYSVQLIDQAIEQLRTKATGGIFPTSKPSSVIKVLLGGISKGLELSDEYRPKDILMWAPDIDDTKEHVIVKQGVPLCDLPGYLQKFYGLYNTGMACFYYNQYWYVWPLYNTMRFNQADNNLVVVQVPRNKFPGIETTYEERGSTLAILATGETAMIDVSNRNQMNSGNGIRVARASGISGNTGTSVSQGTAVVSRGTNNIEVVTAERRSGVTYAPTANTISDNVAKVVSETAVNNGAFVQLTWENSRPDLIKPGMPTKLMYLKDGAVVQRYGVLVKMESSYEHINPGLADTWMRCNTALTMFVSNTDDSNDTDTVIT